jgi:hypothetical protein
MQLKLRENMVEIIGFEGFKTRLKRKKHFQISFLLNVMFLFKKLAHCTVPFVYVSEELKPNSQIPLSESVSGFSLSRMARKSQLLYPMMVA